jgi:hypothetical protein
MGEIRQIPRKIKQPRWVIRCNALRSLLDDGLRRGINELSPQQTRRLAHHFRRACSAADRADVGVPEMCYVLRGTPDWWALAAEMELLTKVDDRADSLPSPEPVVIVFPVTLSDRERIRRSRPWFATTGPPPDPKNSTAAAESSTSPQRNCAQECLGNLVKIFGTAAARNPVDARPGLRLSSPHFTPHPSPHQQPRCELRHRILIHQSSPRRAALGALLPLGFSRGTHQ